MAQFDLSKIDIVLNISGEYSNALDIEGFSLMMKNPFYCYKFYWLGALVILISVRFLEKPGKGDITDDSIR